MTGSSIAQYQPSSDSCSTIDAPTRAALGEITARAFTLAGVRPRDTVQVTQTIDASGSAWPVLWALDQLDAVVVASSGLRATPALRQLEFLRRFGVSTLCADDDVVDALAAAAHHEGVDLAALHVQRIMLTAPALTSARRREIEAAWSAAVFCVWASPSAPMWAAAECDASRRAGGSLGLHLLDQAAIADLDRDARVLTGACPCGVTTRRVLFEEPEV